MKDIGLIIRDKVQNRQFTIYLTYDKAILRLKKLSYSSKLYCIQFIVDNRLISNDYYEQLSYWWYRQLDIVDYDAIKTKENNNNERRKD